MIGASPHADRERLTTRVVRSRLAARGRRDERLRPRRAEDMEIRGEVSASVRAGGGAPAPVQNWSAEEQRGVASADDDVRGRLVRANQEYEARFGHIFIVCATGKSAGEMLNLLEQRLSNDPAQELHVAAEEQRKITRLRLAKLLDEIAS